MKNIVMCIKHLDELTKKEWSPSENLKFIWMELMFFNHETRSILIDNKIKYEIEIVLVKVNAIDMLPIIRDVKINKLLDE